MKGNVGAALILINKDIIFYIDISWKGFWGALVAAESLRKPLIGGLTFWAVKFF